MALATAEDNIGPVTTPSAGCRWRADRWWPLAGSGRQTPEALRGTGWPRAEVPQQAWIELASLSDGIGDGTEVRAGQLGIQYFLAGIKDKPSALAALQKRLVVTANQTSYLGNDLNALAVRSQVNLLISPREGCIPLL